MKNLKINLIAVLLTLTATFLTIDRALANEGGSNSSNVYLTSGENVSFDTFMHHKAKRYVRKNTDSWNTFSKVIYQYNHSIGSFLKLKDTEKADFLQATASIKAQLENMKHEEAAKWLKKVEATENIFSFLWESKMSKEPAKYIYELPKLEIKAMVGR